MDSLYFIIPTLLVVIISLIIVRAGAIALMMTGMDFESAKFQALSAFSGTGFTTHASERIVNNSARRKIISILIILGHAGVVTVIVTATSSFSQLRGNEIGLNLLLFLLGLIFIFIIANSSPLTIYLEKFVRSRLAKLEFFDDETTTDAMLHMAEGYGVVQIYVTQNSMVYAQTIFWLKDFLDHARFIGIQRGNEWLTAPKLDDTLQVGDYLVLYGKLDQ